MGYGLPAAVAAKLAAPHRTVVAVCGDGGFGMSLVELATAVRYEAQVIAVVFNDDAYGSIERHQRNHYDGRLTGSGLHNPAFDELARAFGAFGARVREPGDFPALFARAIASGRPAVLEVPS
jgi:acetolactate synthase-1/2/3 large subunit